MNEFVEGCRGEWKRLGVPDPVANEMAAELAADLEVAEAEGASAEEVLGSDAFDPRSFAAAWAAERGVIQRPMPSRYGLLRRSRLPAALAAFALIAIAGAVLVILASPSGTRRLTLTLPGGTLPITYAGTTRRAYVGPPLRVVEQPVNAVWVQALPATPIVAVHINETGVDTRTTVGWVLLIAGLAGLVPLTMLWLWVRRRADV